MLRTADGGRTWQIAETPLAASASAGIFSVAFRDRLHGLTVGGDYRKEKDAVDNAAVTGDGGITWTADLGPRRFPFGRGGGAGHEALDRRRPFGRRRVER